MAEDETLANYCPACGGKLVQVPTTFDLHPHFVCFECGEVFLNGAGGIERCPYPDLHVVPGVVKAIAGRRSPVAGHGGTDGP